MAVEPTDLKIGADVISSDGHKLGELRRLVLRRADLSISHIVVDIGFLRSGRPVWAGGFGLDYDRLVPLQAITSVEPNKIDIAMTAEAFKQAAEYTLEQFEVVDDLTPGDFDIADVATEAQRLAAALGSTPTPWVMEKLNRPIGGVEVAQGTDVWRREPHTKLGEVERALLDEQGRVVAFVIRRGFLLTRDVILPVRYVAELLDDIVRVDISDGEIDQLREYKED